MKRYVTMVCALVVSTQMFSQDNIFLNRDFWTSKPTVETIDQKIKDGHDIAEANASNFDGVTQAILADAPFETITYAISKDGNDINKITHDNRTYIFWAAYRGNLKLMQFLIDQGAKTDITDNKGSTIVNFAAGSGQKNTEVYDLMLQHGANLQNDLTPAGANALLLIAPHDTDFTLINYFISKGLPLNSTDTNGNGVFNYAAKTGNITLMKQLMDKGITGNDNAFIFASQGARGVSNGIEVYKFLESVGLKPNTVSKNGTTPLHALASRSKDMEVISYFLDHGANVTQKDAEGNTPFMNAAGRNTLEIVTLLFKDVQDINETNKKGESVLSMAVANNSPEIVAFLLDHDADTTILDAEGNNLSMYLMQAYAPNQEDNFRKKLALLQDHGFKFGTPQANGNTLYHLALMTNDLDAVKFVQPYAADVNAKNIEGNAPLHIAAMKAKNLDILEYLLSIGAKKSTVTDFEETAYDLALENELLQQQKISVSFLK